MIKPEEEVQQEKSPLRQAEDLKLNTKNYLFRNEQYYCYARDARRVIQSVNPDVKIDSRYLRNPVAYKLIERICLDRESRLYAYKLADLLKIRYNNTAGHCVICGNPLTGGQRKYDTGPCRQKAYHLRKKENSGS